MADTSPLGPPVDRVRMRTRVAGSVRFRLTLAVSLVVGLALLGGGTLLVRWVEATLTNDVRVRNEQVLESMADLLSQGQFAGELLYSPSELESEIDEQADNGLYGRIQDFRQVISTTYFYIEGPAFEELKIRGVNSRGQLVLFGREGPPRPDDADSIEVTRTVATQWGGLTIHAVTPVSEIDNSVGALRTALWLGLPLLVLAAGAMTWLITSQALAPVAAMTRRVRELSSTNLDARVPVPPNDDEVALLAVTMNDMLDRLEKASVKQRQFISDASHELRSPVASIRTQLETALRYPDDVDWPSIARVVLAEDDRLDHLVGNLLAMARLEEGRLGPRSEVDLDELVMAQAPRMTGVELDLSAVSAGRVWGNSDELTSVIRNLLDNAARHAAGRVAVTVREAGPWVVLTVSDDGAGIPTEQREAVFERFARMQEGRERDSGGTGLGLALTRRIVEAHGGRIHVEDCPLGGACFVVALPAAAWTGPDDDTTAGRTEADLAAAGQVGEAGADVGAGDDDVPGDGGGADPDGTSPSVTPPSTVS